MGNGQTCEDCKTKVPKKVKWLDNIGGDWGQRFCKWANKEIWIKIGSDKYLCSTCLIKRQNHEKEKQQNEKKRQEEMRQEEERRKEVRRQEEIQIKKQQKKLEEESRQEAERQQIIRRQEESRQKKEKIQDENRQNEMRRNKEERQETMRLEENRRRDEKQYEKRRKEERRQEEMRRKEIERNQRTKFEEETRREKEKQQEIRRQEEMRQEEKRRQEEIQRKEEEKQQRMQFEEEQRREEELRQEIRRQEEMQREEIRLEEEIRRKVEERHQRMRLEEERRREEEMQQIIRRQEERQQEERLQNEKRHDEMRRQEEQLNMQLQEERRQEEQSDQYKTRQEVERQQELKRVEKERLEYKIQEEHTEKTIKERLSIWERRDYGKHNKVEQLQNREGYLTTRLCHYMKIQSLPKGNLHPKIERTISIEEEKDDNYVLQEMSDKGQITVTEKQTIGIVLLAVQEKIKSYKINQMPQSPDLDKTFRSKKYIHPCNEKEFSDCIFEICLAVKLSKAYWPRNTQIASLCLLVKAIQKGILLEINTGEGKTCIIAMFSAFLAFCENAVDIVSSSPILAKRDYQEWKEFYKSLKVSVSCNLIPQKTEERLECYSNEIVYGTVGSFASDLLRQTFLMENVRGKRKCQAVIVDEVDCMLLDQGVHFTYLSHAVPGMHHIEPILLMIWKHILKHEKIASENSEHFFLGVLDSLHVVLSSYIDLNDLCNETKLPPEIQLLCLFESNKILNDDFTNKVLQGNTTEYKCIFTVEKILECLDLVQTIYPITFQPYIILDDTSVRAVPWKSLSDSPKSKIVHLLVVGEGLLCVLHPYEDEQEIHNFVKDEINNYISFDTSEKTKHHIPKYLQEFVDNRIISWIENAFTAKHMLNGREYLVTDNDVIPVDFESTGVVQLDTKWGDCLHQFLEIKHGKKISQLTLVTNFMSNQEYFCRYKGTIFGVSGTLGTERDKSFLKRQFSLDCQKIPTHRSKVFKEIPGKICSSKKEWIITIQTIVQDQVTKSTNKGRRAVLVICEDINTAKELKKILTDNDHTSAALYTRNDENNDNIAKKLKAGDVIVATNLAGRGTDIDIEESVEKAGGLFVLVTFLPQNTRIENQVFGRSARKGQPGSGQIVLNKQSLPLGFSLLEVRDIENLKHLRDEVEKKRIADIEEHAFKEVQLKEELFRQYCSFLLKVKEQLNFKDVDEKIMLDSLHEYWGIWLKMNCENLTINDQQKSLKESLDNTLEFAKKRLIEKKSPSSNISHIIKFANEQLLDKNYDLSLDLFKRAIDTNKEWAAIAHTVLC